MSKQPSCEGNGKSKGAEPAQFAGKTNSHALTGRSADGRALIQNFKQSKQHMREDQTATAATNAEAAEQVVAAEGSNSKRRVLQSCMAL